MSMCCMCVDFMSHISTTSLNMLLQCWLQSRHCLCSRFTVSLHTVYSVLGLNCPMIWNLSWLPTGYERGWFILGLHWWWEHQLTLDSQKQIHCPMIMCLQVWERSIFFISTFVFCGATKRHPWMTELNDVDSIEESIFVHTFITYIKHIQIIQLIL